MFKKFTPPVIQDTHHEWILSQDVNEWVKEKTKEFWKNEKWFDIYIKYTQTGEKMIVAAERITKDQLNDKDSIGKYMEERKYLEYICQYPHKDYKKAIREYEVFSKVYEYDAEDCFSKTEYFPDREYIWFPKNKVKYRSLKEGQMYSNKNFIFRTMMYTFLKDEIIN